MSIVDNNAFVAEKLPLVQPVASVGETHGSIALLTLPLDHHMTKHSAPKSLQIDHSQALAIDHSQELGSVASFTTRLTNEQFDALSRCAKAISLRFDDLRIVDALIAGGYAQRGVAGVVTVTARGYEYLRNGR